MATKDLNIRLGFIFDEKSLKQVENSLKRTGDKLQGLGQSLSVSVTAPLAALGLTAIKSAGDIESLTLALKSQLGSADAATKELAKLTEAAKNPGIGLEQAVKGSVRLQGVQFSADEARKVITQMGNAIASTGGSAQELDNVTRQFAQMASKGRVLQEDISVIAESMPGLSGLMLKAFGTTNVDNIRKMGISGKDFVLAITQAAEGLPRVESGIKNSIGNAIDSLKQAAAKLGFALNNAFDITGSIEKFANFIGVLADGFAGLNPVVQNIILGFAGVLAAIGPISYAFGTAAKIGQALVGTWSALVGSRLGVFLGECATAMRALSLATQAFIIIGLAVAAYQIADSFGLFNNELTQTEKIQQSVNKLNEEATASIGAEKTAASSLIGILQSETSSREAKKAALAELVKISPEYFGQLKIENGQVVGLTAAYDGYIKNLLLAAKAKKAESRLIEIDAAKTQALQDQAAAQKELNALQSSAPQQGFNRNETGGGIVSGTASAAGAAAAKITELGKAINALNQEEAQLTTISQAGFEAIAKQRAAAEAAATSTKKFSDSTGELSTKAKALKEILADVQVASDKAMLLGDDKDLAKIDALKTAIGKMLDLGLKPASAEVQNLKKQLDALTAAPALLDATNLPINPVGTGPLTSQAGPSPLPDFSKAAQTIAPTITLLQQFDDIMTSLSAKSLTFSEAFNQAMTLVNEQGTLFQQVALGMGDALSKAALDGQTSFAALGQAAAGAAAKIIRAYIQQGVAAAVAKALSGLPFPLNLAAGAAAGGLAAALFTKAIGSIGVKGFAKGTKFAPGGMSLVGEKGPELVNLPRGSQVVSNGRTNAMLSDMGGGQVVVGGTLKADGKDLFVIIEKQNKEAKRSRGYGL